MFNVSIFINILLLCLITCQCSDMNNSKERDRRTDKYMYQQQKKIEKLENDLRYKKWN